VPLGTIQRIFKEDIFLQKWGQSGDDLTEGIKKKRSQQFIKIVVNA
jgi:hypothetical protein